MDTRTSKYTIPNLKNASRILKYLADRGSPKRITDISKMLSIPRTSVMRILTTLHEEGLISKNKELYHLGPKLISLGLAARSSIGIREIAMPYLQETMEKTGETCHLAIPAERKSLIIEAAYSPHPLTVARNPGNLVDIHSSATGKIFLAFLHKHDLEEYLPEAEMTQHTPNTFTSHESLRRNLREVERQGYAIDEQEYFLGVRCIALPIYDHGYNVIAAIGMTASIHRFPPEKIPELAKVVGAVTSTISTQLGAR